jgi:predicted nucleic-acid-binding protein
MRKIIVDTNVFLRFLLEDIPSQKKEAENLFRKAQKGSIEIIVPQIIIFEIEFISRKYYRFSVAEISSKIKSLLNAEYFQISERLLFLKSLEIYQSKNISFVDSFLVSFAELEGFEIFSFDKKLQKI